MGEQPNPWEVLPPQDATSRHRAISAVTGGADYLSTVLFRATGRRLIAAIDSPPRRQNRYLTTLFESGSVVTGSRRGADRSRDGLPTVLSSCEESTVISRFFRRVSTTSPQLEVPNHAVAVNAWA